MPTATNTQIVVVAGISIQSTQNRSASGQVSHQLTLPHGTAGALTTRTDDDDGVVTLEAGHGLITADVVDLFWNGGCRYGVATVVAGNAVTISGGSGDNLPDQDTAVVMTKQVTIDTDFDGDLVELVAAMNNQVGHVDFQTEAGVSLAARPLVANEVWTWVAGTGAANPLSGDPVGKIKAANGSSTTDSTLKIGILYAST